MDYPRGFIASYDNINKLSDCRNLCEEDKNCVRILAVPANSKCILKNSDHEEGNTDTSFADKGVVSLAMESCKKKKEKKKDKFKFDLKSGWDILQIPRFSFLSF